MTDIKFCSRCKLPFQATDTFFTRDKNSPDGLFPQCKQCRKEYRHQPHVKAKEKESEKKPERKEARKRYRERIKLDPVLSQKKKDKDREKEKSPSLKATRKAYRNSDRGRKIQIDYATELRKTSKYQEYIKNYQREWAVQNRTKLQVYKLRYRSRKRSLPDNFTNSDWQRALDYFGGCCAVCGRPPGLWHTLAMDHWIPLNSPDCPGTIPSNILPLCHGQDGCNNSKNDSMPTKWLLKRVGKTKLKAVLERIENYFEQINSNLI